MARREWAVPAGLVTAYGIVAGYRLGQPDPKVFDESYYVRDALVFLNGGEEITLTHPPLGKWLIAVGIELFGNDPFGWRAAAWLAGTVGVLLTYLLARRLLASVGWAALTTAFTALSGLYLVHTRVAMLEIFLTTFLVGTALAFVVHLQRGDEEPTGRSTGHVVDGPLVAAGLLAGCALAVKWSALPVLVLLAAATTFTAADRRRGLAGAAVAFGLLPALVYVAAYARFWVTEGLDVAGWWQVHTDMLAAETELTAGHSGASAPWSWPLMLHPVQYHVAVRGNGAVEEILALGNPLLWWGGVASLPALVVTWWRRRDRTVELVLGAWVALWLPWLVVSRPTFAYYLTPLAPFAALGVVWCLRALGERGGFRRDAAVGYAALVLTAGVLLFPAATSLPLDPSARDAVLVLGAWR